MDGDLPCRRRVTKRHLRSRYLGCRQCLDLTYYSSQSAHSFERVIAAAATVRQRYEDRFGKIADQ